MTPRDERDRRVRLVDDPHLLLRRPAAPPLHRRDRLNALGAGRVFVGTNHRVRHTTHTYSRRGPDRAGLSHLEDEGGEECIVPSGSLDLASDGALAGVEVQGDPAQDGQIEGSVVGPSAGPILVEHDVHDPVQLVSMPQWKRTVASSASAVTGRDRTNRRRRVVIWPVASSRLAVTSASASKPGKLD